MTCSLKNYHYLEWIWFLITVEISCLWNYLAHLASNLDLTIPEVDKVFKMYGLHSKISWDYFQWYKCAFIAVYINKRVDIFDDSPLVFCPVNKWQNMWNSWTGNVKDDLSSPHRIWCDVNTDSWKTGNAAKCKLFTHHYYRDNLHFVHKLWNKDCWKTSHRIYVRYYYHINMKWWFLCDNLMLIESVQSLQSRRAIRIRYNSVYTQY